MRLQDELKKTRADKVPAGRMPLRQFAVSEGVASNCARGSFRMVVDDAIAAGLVKRKQYWIPLGNGVHKVWHYWRVRPRK